METQSLRIKRRNYKSQGEINKSGNADQVAEEENIINPDGMLLKISLKISLKSLR